MGTLPLLRQQGYARADRMLWRSGCEASAYASAARTSRRKAARVSKRCRFQGCRLDAALGRVYCGQHSSKESRRQSARRSGSHVEVQNHVETPDSASAQPLSTAPPTASPGRAATERAAQRSGFWRWLFGSGGKPAAPDAEWERFFQLASIHERIQPGYKSFVGLWPPEVNLTSLNGAPFGALIKRLHAHISGCHPGRDSKPEYQAVNGKIARRSSTFIDGIVYHALPRKELTATCLEEIPAVVWRLIERHSSAPLAKLLFALPHMHLASAAEAGRVAVLVVNDADIPIYRDLRTGQILQIQIYKGVENTIFGAYEDLPEGGYLTGQVIDRKLRSLLG